MRAADIDAQARWPARAALHRGRRAGRREPAGAQAEQPSRLQRLAREPPSAGRLRGRAYVHVSNLFCTLKVSCAQRRCTG